MDPVIPSANDNIRKIEDIIDIQKANGNFSVRQVAFTLPAQEAGGAAAAARSLESGLASRLARRKTKKRSKRPRSPLPDAVSWPSDSDITVLRMKLCLEDAATPRGKVGDAALGDGLHRPDGSSMVNLATLVLHSQPASKHSLPSEEFLLPLTSWEPPRPPPQSPAATLAPIDSNMMPHPTRTSKLAKFLRLYFCPCCTCLYEMEKMREEQSVYLTRSRSPVNALE